MKEKVPTQKAASFTNCDAYGDSCGWNLKESFLFWKVNSIKTTKIKNKWVLGDFCLLHSWQKKTSTKIPLLLGSKQFVISMFQRCKAPCNVSKTSDGNWQRMDGIGLMILAQTWFDGGVKDKQLFFCLNSGFQTSQNNCVSPHDGLVLI